MGLKRYFSIIFLASIILIIGCSSIDYDSFAQCITENGAKMYGAYWCGHCANQKAAFGNSFQYVDYIECSLPGGSGQTEFCQQAEIRSYPTWEFADGERLLGEVSFKELSAKTGCKLGE